MKKTVKDTAVQGKTTLVRCDFNVPMEEGKITNDARIKAALPTINYLIEHGAKVVLMSHMGRPKGEPNKAYTLAPVAERLGELLSTKVTFAQSDVVVDASVKDVVSAMQN
ncbi:MAG: phosphoglycerate kinase, partial [Anaerovoracaceae bacterium]